MLVAIAGISRPLNRVRRALREIEQGDLDVHLPVDDLGELGRLSEGVNDLVAGIREREELRELFGRQVGQADLADMALQGRHLGRRARGARSPCCSSTSAATRGSPRRHEPEEVVAMLNRFFRVVVAVVNREGGWINKFEGDAALCLFGAPQDQPDHAERALRAAESLPTGARRDRRAARRRDRSRDGRGHRRVHRDGRTIRVHRDRRRGEPGLPVVRRRPSPTNGRAGDGGDARGRRERRWLAARRAASRSGVGASGWRSTRSTRPDAVLDVAARRGHRGRSTARRRRGRRGAGATAPPTRRRSRDRGPGAPAISPGVNVAMCASSWMTVTASHDPSRINSRPMLRSGATVAHENVAPRDRRSITTSIGASGNVADHQESMTTSSTHAVSCGEPAEPPTAVRKGRRLGRVDLIPVRV